MKLHLGNSIDVMDEMINNGGLVDMVMTSPPYDDIKNYNHTLDWNFNVFKSIADRLYQVVTTGGVIVWVVGDKTSKYSESGTSFKQALYFMELGFKLYDTMIYKKKNYVPLTHRRYEQCFEYMFVFSKGKPKTFNPIMLPTIHAGRVHKTNHFYKTDDDEPQVLEYGKLVKKEKIHPNVFEYAVAVESKKFKHPAMYPLALAKDQISTWTNEGDVVLDPFMGAATTGVACQELNRDFIGIEVVEKYYNIATDRLSYSV